MLSQRHPAFSDALGVRLPTITRNTKRRLIRTEIRRVFRLHLYETTFYGSIIVAIPCEYQKEVAIKRQTSRSIFPRYRAYFWASVFGLQRIGSTAVLDQTRNLNPTMAQNKISTPYGLGVPDGNASRGVGAPKAICRTSRKPLT